MESKLLFSLFALASLFSCKQREFNQSSDVKANAANSSTDIYNCDLQDPNKDRTSISLSNAMRKYTSGTIGMPYFTKVAPIPNSNFAFDTESTQTQKGYTIASFALTSVGNGDRDARILSEIRTDFDLGNFQIWYNKGKDHTVVDCSATVDPARAYITRKDEICTIQSKDLKVNLSGVPLTVAKPIEKDLGLYSIKITKGTDQLNVEVRSDSQDFSVRNIAKGTEKNVSFTVKLPTSDWGGSFAIYCGQ